MKIIENLHWILDKNDRTLNNDEEYRINIDFVHSLGLKCDCVGWSSLDLQSPKADEILSAIYSFCKENGWKARGVYKRKFADFTSDWYKIVPSSFKDNTRCAYNDVESEQGNEVTIYTLRAYHELRASPKNIAYDSFLVPDRFRDACIRHNVTDVDYCWAKDIGKYKAEQYFHLYCNNQIPTVAVCNRIDVDKKEIIEGLGGYLPKIANIFYKLDLSSSQTCYIESDMPKCNIANAYLLSTYSSSGKTYSHCEENSFLIHKSLAEILLEEKAISQSDLTPAMVVKELPKGYTLGNTVMLDRPTLSYMQKSIDEYETLKNTERPLNLISEKSALKILRSAKKEQKEAFNKGISKVKALEIAETKYAPVVPYYIIANGGELSDEYEFLSYEKAIEESEALAKELLAEELLDNKPDGIVIAKCPDGDRILLCNDGKVIRFSHEEPVSTDEWVSIAQFIADTVNE